jgi:hypothetical protein
MRNLPRLRLLAILLIPAGAIAQQVTVPLAKYEELRARANPSADDPAPPPAPFALEVADLSIQAGEASARLVQDLRLTLYTDRWQTIPLGGMGSFISSDFGDLEGRVEAKEGSWSLQARGRGAHRVRLESVVPVERDETATRPTWGFSLWVPPAAVVRGRIEAPPGVEEVVIGGPGLVRRAADGKGWSFVAAPNSTVAVSLSGKATLPERARLPLRFEATSATATALSRTKLEIRAWIEARVAQGRLEDLRIPVPAGFEVVGVKGPIAGWNVVAGKVVVTPLAPVESSLAVELELTGEPRDAFATPLLTPDGSARTSFLAKAALRGDGLLNLADAGSARPPDEREAGRLPESLRAAEGRLVAVLDPARPPRWEAVWAERTEVLAAQVDRLLVDVAVGESGRASYQLWAEVRNRGAQQLALTFPAGFELVSGERDGVTIEAGAAGTAGLAVPLLAGETPQVVHVAGVMPLPLPQGNGELLVPLPSLSAPAARVEVRVILPGGRSYALADSTRAGGVAPPSQRAVRETTNQIAQQLNTAFVPALVSPGAWAFFSQPPGFAQVQAAWSALSATPAPLAIRVESAREKVEWF